MSLQLKSDKAVVLAEAPVVEVVRAPEPPTIKQEIAIEKKEAKEIGKEKEIIEKPEKPESGCFFSFC